MLAVTTRRLSGLNAAYRTWASCLKGGVIGAPVAASQTCAAPSPQAVTIGGRRG